MEMGADDRRFLRGQSRPADCSKRPLRIVDLFAGCGGMTLGVLEACALRGRGLRVVLAMEIQERIRAVYDSNFTSEIDWARGDVLERFDGKVGARLTRMERATARGARDVDLLVGGPP